MASVTNQYEIVLGTSVTETTQYTVLEAGAQGTPSALRTLLHPDSLSPLVTYQRNPDRTINFSVDPLFVPSHALEKTAGTTLPFITPNSISDVVVTEIWEGSNRRASTTGAFLRRLRELIINPPDFSPGPDDYVIWAPNDLVDDGRTYYVVLLDLRVGGQSLKLDVKEYGIGHFDDFDTVTTGILDRTVELDMLLRSEVP